MKKELEAIALRLEAIASRLEVTSIFLGKRVVLEPGVSLTTPCTYEPKHVRHAKGTPETSEIPSEFAIASLSSQPLG